MNSSKYLKSPQAFYDELAACIKENDSHKVLSVLLRMGLSGANIHDIVSGHGLENAKPLYLEAVGKDEMILQHLQEWGVIIPENIPVSQPSIPTPKGLASNQNRMFAQHFIFRRTQEGKEIFKYAPACKGFCYEYVSYHMRPHKNTDEDFMDKLLRELYQHSPDFYQRIKEYQDFASSRFTDESNLVQFDYNNTNILDSYTDELKKAEFVLFNLQFENMAHCIVIHKIDTKDGKRYQFFDPTAYDAKWLTAEKLNERFREQMQKYNEDWEWGKIITMYFSDLAPTLKKMEHLQNYQDKYPFKNIHRLKKGLQNQDVDSIKKFLEHAVMSADAIKMNQSVSATVFQYLIHSDNAIFIKNILNTLSPNNLWVMTQQIMSSLRNPKVGIVILEWVLESTYSTSLHETLIHKIKDVLMFQHALENKKTDAIQSLIHKFELNIEEMRPNYTTYSISSMLFSYLINDNESTIKKKIIETVSENDFIRIVNILLPLENNLDILELIKSDKKYTFLTNETVNQIERISSIYKSLNLKDINCVNNHLKDYKMSKEDNDIYNSNTNIIFMHLIYDKSNFRKAIMDALSDHNFNVMAAIAVGTRMLMGKEKKDLLRLFLESDRFEQIPEETENRIRTILGVEKQVNKSHKI